MMTDYLKQIVILQHATLYDAHTVALVIGQSKSFVKIREWDSWSRDWNKENKKRKITAIKNVLGPSESVDLIDIHRVFERIQSANSHMAKTNRKVIRDYHEKIRDMKLGD